MSQPRTERFTGRAGAYVAGRPSYPREALDALFAGLGDPHRLVAVDLGAGTGISSRLLAERGARVYAVEPNASMRDAAEPHPRVTWVDATAEATGLPEGSADLVAAFQAFHWFEHRPALDEMQRLLRSGGRAALVYNERDEVDAFTTAYGDVVRAYAQDRTEALRAKAREAFAALASWARGRTIERIDVRHPHRLDRAALRARTSSASYLPKDGPPAEAMHAEVDALFDRYAVDGAVTMSLVTIVLAVRG